MRGRIGSPTTVAAFAAAFLMLLATAAQAVIVTVTANPETLPSGGGTVEYTVSVTCEPTDSFCFIKTIDDDIHGPITEEDCPSLAPFTIGETRSCTFTRQIAADGPTTITNTTTVTVATDHGDSTLSDQATVTVLAPEEENEGSGGGGGGSSFASCDVDGVPTAAELKGCVDRHVSEEFTRRGVPGYGGSTVSVSTGGSSESFESLETSVEESEITTDAPDIEDIETEVENLL